MSEIKIEKGVSIPSIKRRGVWADLLRRMEVGASIVVLETKSSAVFVCAKRLGIHITSRKESPTEYRIWRIEKEAAK